MNKHAQALGRKRWEKIPKAERSQLVPCSGGRPRIYPQCPRYKAHRFVKVKNVERCEGSVMHDKYGCRRCSRPLGHRGECDYTVNGPFDKPWETEGIDRCPCGYERHAQ